MIIALKRWISKGNIQDTSYKIIGQWKADLGIPGWDAKYLERPRQNFVEQRYFLAVIGIMENCWQWGKKGYSQFCCITWFEHTKVFQHYDILENILRIFEFHTWLCIIWTQKTASSWKWPSLEYTKHTKAHIPNSYKWTASSLHKFHLISNKFLLPLQNNSQAATLLSISTTMLPAFFKVKHYIQWSIF